MDYTLLLFFVTVTTDDRANNTRNTILIDVLDNISFILLYTPYIVVIHHFTSAKTYTNSNK